MKLRHLAVLALVTLSVVGCKKKRPVDTPPNRPAATDTAGRGAAAAAAAAEAERLRLARERAEAEARERARVREALSEMVFFDYDSYTLNAEAEDRLRAKAELLRRHPAVRLRIEGHADQRGSTEYNLALGQRRAEAVREFLAAYGIEADRVSTLSYGKERPLLEGEGESAWARNRRAEFTPVWGQP